MRLHSHADTQPVKVSKRWKGFEMYSIYVILHFEYLKCARMRFHCTNGFMVAARLRTLEGKLFGITSFQHQILGKVHLGTLQILL